MQKTFTVSGHTLSAHVEPKLQRFWDLLGTGRWEPATFEIFKKYIRPGAIVADIGAWIGPTALFAAHIAETVHAFEPDHAAFAALKKNIDLNPGLADRIILHNAALTNFDGTITMVSPGQAGMSESSTMRNHGDTSFNAKALDAKRVFAEELNDVEFIKMDIEGGEYDTIPAMADFIYNRNPIILLSLHPDRLGRDMNERQRKDYIRARTAAILQTFRGYGAAFRISPQGISPAPDIKRFLHGNTYVDPGDNLLLIP